MADLAILGVDPEHGAPRLREDGCPTEPRKTSMGIAAQRIREPSRPSRRLTWLDRRAEDGTAAAQALLLGTQPLRERPRVTNLISIAHKLDPKALTCRAIIETPRGHRAKLDYDPKHRVFSLKSLLPDGMSFPMDFGFIPSTVGGDGDPLDVMVLMDEPCAVGAMLTVRLLGVIQGEEEEHGRRERNDRLLAAGAISRLYEKVHEAKDLGDDFIGNLVAFWEVKNRLEGKRFSCLGVYGPTKAVELIESGARAAAKA